MNIGERKKVSVCLSVGYGVHPGSVCLGVGCVSTECVCLGGKCL